MKDRKFEVGDKVRVLTDDTGMERKITPIKTGDILEISHISYEKDEIEFAGMKLSSGLFYGFDPGWYELVKDDEIDWKQHCFDLGCKFMATLSGSPQFDVGVGEGMAVALDKGFGVIWIKRLFAGATKEKIAMIEIRDIDKMCAALQYLKQQHEKDDANS